MAISMDAGALIISLVIGGKHPGAMEWLKLVVKQNRIQCSLLPDGADAFCVRCNGGVFRYVCAGELLENSG